MRTLDVIGKLDEVFADLLIRLVRVHKTSGFGLCCLYLPDDKRHAWNHIQVCRISCELEVTLQTKPR
jgi:putative transposase